MPYDTDNRSGITKNASESQVISMESQPQEREKLKTFPFLVIYQRIKSTQRWWLQILKQGKNSHRTTENNREIRIMRTFA